MCVTRCAAAQPRFNDLILIELCLTFLFLKSLRLLATTKTTMKSQKKQVMEMVNSSLFTTFVSVLSGVSEATFSAEFALTSKCDVTQTHKAWKVSELVSESSQVDKFPFC